MAETTIRKRKRSKRTFVIDGDLRRLIRSEAKEFGMSDEEYLRLVLHVSETLRTSIIPAGLFDGGTLKVLLTNPMMLDMLKGMIGNMISKWGSSDSSSGSNSAPVQAQPAQPAQPQAPAAGPWGPPAMPMHPWGGQGAGMSQPGMYAMPGYGPPQPRPMWGGPPQPQPQPQQQPQQQQESSSGGSPFSLDSLSKMMQQLMARN